MELSEEMKGKTGWDEPITDEQVEDWADEVAKLEADRDEYRNLYHLAEAKISSREAIIEQLSETELAKDVTRLEEELEKIICHWCEAEVTEDEANEHYKSCTKNPLRAENEALREFIGHVRKNDYWEDWCKVPEHLRKEIDK